MFWFIMAWGIGANDVANAFGTSVGSGAISLKTALLIACIFEFAGAFLAGGEVTDTIRKGIIDSDQFTNNSDVLVFGMMSALLSAGIWLFVASALGWPVSTTHSIIGAIIGFTVLAFHLMQLTGKGFEIGTTWILSPFFQVGCLCFIQKHKVSYS